MSENTSTPQNDSALDKSTNHIEVSIKDFDKVDDKLSKLTKEITKRKFDWISVCALLVSALALWSTYDSAKKQSETQAYTYWQKFLSLTVDNPELANGLDSIKGKRILYIADTMSRKELKGDDSMYHAYTKYAWFVTAELSSAESIFEIDHSWDSALAQALGAHKIALSRRFHIEKVYDTAFCKLVRRAIQDKQINDSLEELKSSATPR